jgi:hypothetical protein
MTIFYLHVHTGNDVALDIEGIDRPDLAAATAEAIRGARSLMCSEVLLGELSLDQWIEIHAPAGHRLSTVEFADALFIRASRNGVTQRRSKAVPS